MKSLTGISTLGLAVVVASMSLGVAPAAAHTPPPDELTVAEFADALADAAPTDPVAAASAQTFDELSPAEQQRVVDIVDDPAFALEFLEFASSTEAPAPGEAAVVEESSLFPDVEYRSSTELGTGNELVGATAASGFSAGRPITYPANSVQTLRASSTSVILGVEITRLNIWITFKTGAQGIPKTVLSSGSSATNFNFFIVISNTNLTPYVSLGLAVARTVWTGSVLVKGSTFRFDKLDTLKAFSGGLYSHTLVNQ